MKILVFTSEESEETRAAKDLGASLSTAGYEVAYLDPTDPETGTKQELYDIYSYPSFVVTQDDGTLIERWRGRIPLESDIKMFLLS